MFLLGAVSCFVYFVIAGALQWWLAESTLGGAEWFFVTLAWPLGLPYLAVRKVWR